MVGSCRTHSLLNTINNIVRLVPAMTETPGNGPTSPGPLLRASTRNDCGASPQKINLDSRNLPGNTPQAFLHTLWVMISMMCYSLSDIIEQPNRPSSKDPRDHRLKNLISNMSMLPPGFEPNNAQIFKVPRPVRYILSLSGS